MGGSEYGPPAPEPEERIAKLVHDLRTPLTIVAGFADLLEKRGDELSAQEREDFVRRIAASARELRAILDAERAERTGPPPPG